MNYNEALSYIHSFLKFGSKPGLERVTALLEMVGNPQNNLRIYFLQNYKYHNASNNQYIADEFLFANLFFEYKMA